ncbi:CGNR zinc finger domain-containing protein [Amycolatopsis sp. PS_44_ISF1]|uniref:CGNR zinc finger domain-containing protein n=1 Tax=Amycolatopsis sp. PS_44_ISF1 TaxID=2974917 RepID=UPI0028DF19D7|nr:CGNR zinc finger domain-containing protein [Amycolatopsis sp. PS_44_ISF1]MDT8913106.1 CGNR zinc finger domain-containing protein [Amycolatopsis sp. PS_44_ISF1]
MTGLTDNRPADLAELLSGWDERELGPVPPIGEQDFPEVCAFLDRWTEVVDTTGEAERVRLLNTLLAEAAAYPRITRHDGFGWHLHYRDDGVPLAAVLRAVTSVAAAQYLTATGLRRLSRCAAADCRSAFVDFTRSGTQRYCTHACVNREAVRRHRARKKPAAG